MVAEPSAKFVTVIQLCMKQSKTGEGACIKNLHASVTLMTTCKLHYLTVHLSSLGMILSFYP